MTDAQWFALVNVVPLPGWLALLLAPLSPAMAVAFARLVAASLAFGYMALLGAALIGTGGLPPDIGSLAGLARAFADPHVMLVGWVHYLAFDLWVGSWQVEEADRRGMPHAALIPCLALTFLAGPVGLVLFLALRRLVPLARRRQNHDIR